MDDIGLQELIYQVKRELLAPNRKELAKDPDPLFLIDKVELEIAVKVQREGTAGLKLSVLSFAELNAGAATTRERGHVVKVTLSPLLPKEEILKELLEDPDTRKRIEKKQRHATAKGEVAIAGTPE